MRKASAAIAVLFLAVFATPALRGQGNQASGQSILHIQGTVLQQGIGNIPLTDNQWSGVRGQGRQVEQLNMRVLENVGVFLSYKGNLQGLGDTPWMNQGQSCGTVWQNRGIEAFALRLWGPQALYYDVYYQGHIQDVGASPVYSNGELCGERGRERRIESIKVWIQKRTGPRADVPVYAFRIASEKITNTRSRHEDTNWGVVTVAVNHATKAKTITSMGNQNNGTFQPWAVADNVQVPRNLQARAALSIVNRGHGNTSERSPGAPLVQFAARIATESLKADPISRFTTDIIGSAAALLFANCDGVVWLDARDFSGEELFQGTQNGRFLNYFKDFAGSNSPQGCGSNSHYLANWIVYRDQYR